MRVGSVGLLAILMVAAFGAVYAGYVAATGQPTSEISTFTTTSTITTSSPTYITATQTLTQNRIVTETINQTITQSTVVTTTIAPNFTIGNSTYPVPQYPAGVPGNAYAYPTTWILVRAFPVSEPTVLIGKQAGEYYQIFCAGTTFVLYNTTYFNSGTLGGYLMNYQTNSPYCQGYNPAQSSSEGYYAPTSSFTAWVTVQCKQFAC